jgi:MFS family permease
MRRCVDAFTCSPLPSSGYRGRPLREPCGSPPSSVLWARKTARLPNAAIVTFLFFIVGAGGIVLLHATHDFQWLLLAAGLVGLTIGAEGDLISYLVRAYFGLRSFGTLYGIAFSGYGLGAVIGPVVTGAYFDRYGSYDLPLQVMPALLVGACVLSLTLGRYPRAGGHLAPAT